ncbi:hypothetical protein B484DRAFT_91299 [Ochromonadaceae sp. CCMP2298]|nr:hypothetical protein B484DRAFT_91299 [Ochromonadaceae sp. CCMP2298]
MLLRDFAQVYYICDDFFMLSRRDQWIGVVQRAASGFDMFFLEGLKPGQNSPDKFTRVMSWPDGAPDDIRSVVANFLLADPDFGNGVSIMEGRFGGVGSGGGGGGGVGVGVGGRGGDTRVGEGSRVAGGYINNRGFTTPEEVLRDEEGGRKNVGNSWRNIKPPPRRKTQKRE